MQKVAHYEIENGHTAGQSCDMQHDGKWLSISATYGPDHLTLHKHAHEHAAVWQVIKQLDNSVSVFTSMSY